VDPIADLLFEAASLKRLNRSGYRFLGCGKESVAEHTFSATFVAYVISRLDPSVDALKLVTMCLVHDLPESRLGDLNYVQRFYVAADEEGAVDEMASHLPFGGELRALLEEFNAAETREALLARDADQLSLVLDLKALSDLGYRSPDTWLPNVRRRLRTDIARRLCDAILETPSDHWWRQKFVDR
jgi:putative hydrolase of HD superfamily